LLGIDKEKMDEIYNNSVQIRSNYGEMKDKENAKIILGTTHYKSEFPFDLSGGVHALYVYSNLVKPSFVGDSLTQLIRLVEVPNDIKYGQQIVINYPNPFYVPVLIKEFETIEIDIKDGIGENIPFKFGRAIIVLHFRKINKKSLFL
jgi:hypothetical protein